MMKRKFIFLLLLLTALPEIGWCGNQADSVKIDVRLGYGIGGTAPVGMPATIRNLNSYTMQPNFSFGADIQKDFTSHWGIMSGIHIENKGMKTDATVKNYHMEIVRENESLTGNFTGRDVAKVKEWMLTIPVQATFRVNDLLLIKFGPYASLLMSKEFSGYVYNGYLRVGNPTGPKVEMGNDESTRGTYDFSSDMRRMQYGLDLGADFYCWRNIGIYADVSWGFTGIFHSSFKTVEQTLYPIYGTIGVIYRLK
jgi:hypothetical protein